MKTVPKTITDGYELNELVLEAVAALSAFGENLNRGRAMALLSMWKRRPEMSDGEVLAVLRRFPGVSS